MIKVSSVFSACPVLCDTCVDGDTCEVCEEDYAAKPENVRTCHGEMFCLFSVCFSCMNISSHCTIQCKNCKLLHLSHTILHMGNKFIIIMINVIVVNFRNCWELSNRAFEQLYDI